MHYWVLNGYQPRKDLETYGEISLAITYMAMQLGDAAYPMVWCCLS